MYIKQMQLCDTKHRQIVDLRNYAIEIEKSVLRAVPLASVKVAEKTFTLISSKKITYDEAVPIGKHMGQTVLGTFTKTHLYTCGKTGKMRVSHKIFIEVKKPKGKIIIDDNHKECTLLEVVKELCAEEQSSHDVPQDEVSCEEKQEACDAPQDEMPCREAEAPSQEDRQETHYEDQDNTTNVPTQEPEQEELPSSHEPHQSNTPPQDQCA